MLIVFPYSLWISLGRMLQENAVFNCSIIIDKQMLHAFNLYMPGKQLIYIFNQAGFLCCFFFIVKNLKAFINA